MSIEVQKSLFLPEIAQQMLERGFSYIAEPEAAFEKRTDKISINITVYFSEKWDSTNSLFAISHEDVENIIIKIGTPTNNFEMQKIGKTRLYTLYHKFIDYPYASMPKVIGKKVENNCYPIKNELDVRKWKAAFIHYVDNDGLSFLNRYSYLPNVLKEMYLIEKEGNNNYLSLLTGGIDHLFRALIISRLCNDPEYQKKQDRFDGHILQSKYAKWHPYYESLKMKLLTTVPIYDWNI